MQENHLCENRLKFTKYQYHDLMLHNLHSSEEVWHSGSGNRSQAGQDFKEELLGLLHNAGDCCSSL